MNVQSHSPEPYKVSISPRFYKKALELGEQAKRRGDGDAFAAAMREFERRLRIYPQFGDPLSDLRYATGTMRIGIIPPIAMRYGVLEERRLVFVAAMPVLLPKSVG